ncbi:methionine adenosyltransferase [Candidatus Saccharibacteria bacterium]|nr:methionine adenosyltransferase [Candidatus Saccharibacteria bacterium]MCA9328454.1 methionine adenosyltransferase [Candidatus Saccharibacteria bacterium]
MSYQLFTSESVAAGHPDKIADAISDAILDAILEQDPNGRAGLETIVGADTIGLFGEIKTDAKVDFETIARETIAKLGYTNPDWGFSNQSTILNNIHQQSPEIAQGVDAEGAGDQGMMFGFACSETPELMPLPILLAHTLTKTLDRAREMKTLKWLRPDGKSQVTVAYQDGKPVSVEKVVMAVAHDEAVSDEEVRKTIFKSIIKPTTEKYGYAITEDQVVINGTGTWHIPGPDTDAGLTGRKIVVDTYGGYARVGGGAFSGKDPSKVDRSGAYAARYLAKNVVAKGLAERCEVALAYVIGRKEPQMKAFDTFGTETVSFEEIQKFIDELLDTTVSGIITGLDLRKPIYSKTTAYGHFGKEGLPWENIIK